MSVERFLDGKVTLWSGDCREIIAGFEDNAIDACVTDPPYSLVSILKRFGKDGAAPAKSNGAIDIYQRASAGFMGARWDTGEVAFDASFWSEIIRVLKPGAHLLAMGGTRTFHRLVCAIEDAGFEIRDCIGWLYGSGFPKSLDVSKQFDKAAGAQREIIRERYTARRIKPGATVIREGTYGKQNITFTACDTAPSTDAARQWQGFGTALKPAMELICLARKPLSEGTVAANVLKWGTGAINVDGCRVGVRERPKVTDPKCTSNTYGEIDSPGGKLLPDARWPANLLHDGSDEVLAAFPDMHSAGAERGGGLGDPTRKSGLFGLNNHETNGSRFGDSGSVARFFYTAKADSDDRLGSKHPTVKPLDLMQYLVRLITPKGGVVLDPFAGTGTTGEAAWREGMRTILIEAETEYQADIRRRMALAMAGPDERSRESIKEKQRRNGAPRDDGPLFNHQQKGLAMDQTMTTDAFEKDQT